jgi:multidrug efflux pump subunit AcrA (membrane-fusion protein)
VAGTVRAIAPTADPQTRNVLVFADLPKHAELKAGTFARGQFQIGASQALTVPAQSIVVRDGHNYVFVIGADNKAGQRKVETGRRSATCRGAGRPSRRRKRWPQVPVSTRVTRGWPVKEAR